jgi:hypothetical protein
MPEDVSASLMQGLGAGMSIQDVLLSQIDTTNPTMAMVARLISERAASSGQEQPEPEEDEQEEVPKYRLKRLLRVARQLHREAESLRTEVEELQLRNDTLAAALGACYLCWGEYPTCEVCAGKGVPGHFSVSIQAFDEFIVPAIRSVKHQTQPSTPGRKMEYEPVQ